MVRRPPLVNRLLLVLVGLVLGLGWWMTLNARSIYDSELLVFIPVQRILAAAPGSVDRSISIAWMVRATLLLGVVMFVADLSQRSTWLLRLWWGAALAGGSVALLGLVQKATNAEMIFWGPRPTWAAFETFFGTYYYHANAGAFLNLVLPLAVGLAVRAAATRRNPVARALALTLLLVMVGAVFANTSRMGQLLGALSLVAMLVGFRRRVTEAVRASGWKLSAAVAAAVAVGLVTVVQAGRLDRSFGRWAGFHERLPQDSRWLAAEAAWRALPDAGWLGLGPGTFRVVFPYFTGYLGDRISGIWRYLHQDYLQTILEWGYLGTLLWACIIAGGMLTAVRSLRSQRRLQSRIAESRTSKQRGTAGSAAGVPASGTSAEELASESERVSAEPGMEAEAGQGAWTPRRILLLPLVLLALTTVLIHALVDFPLQIASIQLYVAVHLGLCWGSGTWGRRTEDRGQRTEDRGQRTEDRGAE